MTGHLACALLVAGRIAYRISALPSISVHGGRQSIHSLMTSIGNQSRFEGGFARVPGSND